MPRLRGPEAVAGDDSSTILRDSSQATSRRPSYAPSTNSQSPSPSQGSDKENTSNRRTMQTPKDQSMAPPPLPQSRNNSSQANKRRRVGPRPGSVDTTPTTRSARDPSVATYDPHQDMHERQRLRKDMRDSHTELHDNRQEWMNPDSTHLLRSINTANTRYQSVKQTSDATIDSHFLVAAGDLAYKKTQQASLGDGNQGVDIDDFVNKCKIFMRKGDELEAAQGTQRRRQGRNEVDSDEEEEADAIGNAYNWAYLGSRACFPVTCRPPAPSFLLGPLSVQKKARAQTQRRARADRVNPENAVKPRELEVSDLQRQEDSSLTHMCKKIHAQLRDLEYEVEAAEKEDVEESVVDEIVARNHIQENGGISLFHFAFDPRSFGQTVENLFYVSFLIKEGAVGVDFAAGEGGEEASLPTLRKLPYILERLLLS